MHAMTKNKNHWYDGWFYDRFIAPNQDKLYNKIKALIQKDSTLLDVGCGTGRLARFLNGYYSQYTGVDLSIKNIETARTAAEEAQLSTASFVHDSIENFAKNPKTLFDYAVITYVIHEVDEPYRVDIIKAMAKISQRIIIGDYLIPPPPGFWSLLNEAVEFIAGKEHYTNFKNYERNGGLISLAEKSGLEIVREFKNHPTTAHIIVMEGNPVTT